MWQEIVSLIENNQSFILTSHVNPDGDALGSELALAEHLRNLGKEVTIINNDPVPAGYSFLDPQRLIQRYSAAKHADLIRNVDVVMVLDASGGWPRIGRAGEIFEQTKAIKICIDHHPDATDFVDVAVVDTTAAATAELIYDLLVVADSLSTGSGHSSLTKSIAQALYVAILTDTGSFRFPKTSARTHRVTAELLAAGVNPLHIYNQLYEQYSLEQVRLKGHVIDSIRTEANGQLAYYSLDQDTLKAYGVKASELDGFASLGQEVRGVCVTVFGLEIANNQVKISLRSDGTVAINQVALAYGGGGHPSAAGATIEGQLEGVMAEVVQKVKALL